ncbi:peptidoglycan-binding domain-containing protein [Oceanibacterium hippocampi]|uniref:Putative peptidoglycan binding domain protein n=1 Tax=Oceanibacterium hippocampi TaxID=745714 RepID=A0A1Y5S2R6_9PROT|nr:peptidoglycan-binding domain-containing protein [Oceanibacterium hippocampi]SLN31401.1 Putative peptidoglycan binding domain protein [Oceanibacterium hippocampi]
MIHQSIATVASPRRLGLAGLAAGLALVLAGCGSTQHDRAISGAGIGAAAGTVVGAVTGLSLLQGAAIGAAAGGLTGAFTSKEDVNLGEPAWKRGGGGTQSASGDSTVREIQGGLLRLGYPVGSADGVMGPATAESIRAYQRDNGLLVDGRPSAELAGHIRDRAG